MTEPIHDLYAITAPGVERVTASELVGLGMTPIGESRGGVSWRGSKLDLYRANLWLRTATRVLVRVANFHAESFAELERRAGQLPWGRFVRARDRVKFRVTCHKSALYHSDAVAQRLGESVAAATGCAAPAPHLTGLVAEAPAAGQEDDDTAAGEQLFVVRVDHDNVTVSADSSGMLLHKRGYREISARAPMRETLAAAMLLASGWRGDEPLLDPMCGSGTIPIEAALMARKIAPGIGRDFRFTRWPGFRQSVWDELRNQAISGALAAAPSAIVAADRDAGAVAATASNAARAGVTGDLEIARRALSASRPKGGTGGWLITNPPYGVRIGTDVRNLYASLGTMVRGEFGASGWRLGILVASPELERQLSLQFEQMFESSNGGIPVRFLVSRGTS